MTNRRGKRWSAFMVRSSIAGSGDGTFPSTRPPTFFRTSSARWPGTSAGFRKENAGDTFRGWLHRITDNKVRDHLRKLGREPGGEGGTEAQLRLANLPEPASARCRRVERASTKTRACSRAAVELIRSEFEARTWQAFWLTAVDGRSPGEVAAELGMSRGAVRVAKSRVLKRLREELGGL